jgi:drug/metabolite transporter (DMT)-like permease
VPNRTSLAAIALAFAAFLFGATFVVVKDALDVLPPFGFVGWRFVIGAAVLLAISRPRSRPAAAAGVIAGLWLFAGYACQTKGLVTTSASNSGLVTGLYVVFTPVFAAALRRRAPRPAVFAGAIIAFAGLAALTMSDGFAFQSGDVWTIACAVAFAGHIVYLSRVAHRFPVVALTGVQLAVTGVLGLALSALVEDFTVPGAEMALPLLGTGIFISAGAFLLQVWSQTLLGPSRTALILALEPAFAALTAAVVLDERLGVRGVVGAALILVGIYVVLAGTGQEDELPANESDLSEWSARGWADI